MEERCHSGTIILNRVDFLGNHIYRLGEKFAIQLRVTAEELRNHINLVTLRCVFYPVNNTVKLFNDTFYNLFNLGEALV